MLQYWHVLPYWDMVQCCNMLQYWTGTCSTTSSILVPVVTTTESDEGPQRYGDGSRSGGDAHRAFSVDPGLYIPTSCTNAFLCSTRRGEVEPAPRDDDIDAKDAENGCTRDGWNGACTDP